MGIRVTLLFDPAIEVDYEVFARGKQQRAQWIMWPPGDDDYVERRLARQQCRLPRLSRRNKCDDRVVGE
jgi:hypothetical protein